MKMMQLLLSCACVVLLMDVTSRAKEWRGIVPLHSTRADVERLIGRPSFQYGLYDFENERVSITYSREICAEGAQWNVSRDVVTQISVAPKRRVRLTDLRLDLSRFERIQDPEVQVHTYYVNQEEGIRYDVLEGVGEDDGLIMNIYYEPAARDNHLRCPASASRQPCARTSQQP